MDGLLAACAAQPQKLSALAGPRRSKEVGCLRCVGAGNLLLLDLETARHLLPTRALHTKAHRCRWRELYAPRATALARRTEPTGNLGLYSPMSRPQQT